MTHVPTSLPPQPRTADGSERNRPRTAPPDLQQWCDVSARQLVAYLLIGLGALALLSRVGPGTGWLWVALAAAGFLAAYRKEGTYAFLVVGGILAGTAVGLLIEGAWGWRGAFLMSLGAGFLLIDRSEPRPSRWPIYPAAVLVAVGLVYWLFSAGILQSLWFPFLLIVIGIYLLRRNEDGGWVAVDEPAAAEPAGDEPAAAKPSGKEPVVQGSDVDGAAVERPDIDEQTVEGPDVDEQAVEGPDNDEPVVDSPRTPDAAHDVDEPVVDEPRTPDDAHDGDPDDETDNDSDDDSDVDAHRNKPS